MRNEGNFIERFEQADFFVPKKDYRWIPCGKCNGGSKMVSVDGEEYFKTCKDCGKDVKSYTIETRTLSNVGGTWVYLWWNQTSWIIDYDFNYFKTPEDAIDYLTSKGEIVVKNRKGMFVRIN